jgi:hypothetical protein
MAEGKMAMLSPQAGASVPDTIRAKILKPFLSGKREDGAELAWTKIVTKKFETP